MQSLLVLGRQPALGIAEVESLYGADKVRSVGSKSVIVDVDPCLLAFDRLGGSVKFCKILTELDTTNWNKITKFLVDVSPGHAARMPEGKMTLGLSAVDLDVSPAKIQAAALSVKKAIRKTGRPVRVVPNKEIELSTPQVIHNDLTGERAWEIYLIANGGKTLVAQTIKVQDIAAYAHRDRERPKRDSKIGMLPPKLAQIIINLAVGRLPEDKLENICDIPAGQPIPKPLLGQNVLDPFCGTGVILQEALLMGYGAYGSDLDQRMVDYSQHNVYDWLKSWYSFETDTAIEPADAVNAKWDKFPKIDFVASETYLGRPFTATPSGEILAQTINECNTIIKKFLQNIYDQIESGTRLCLAVPAWQTTPGKFKRLPLIDGLNEIGYNRIKFEHAKDEDLIYARPDQIVGRELLVITRN